MSRWVSDLLAEWQQINRALSADRDAHGEVPRALDLLRAHVKRAGVLLRLTEVEVAVPSTDGPRRMPASPSPAQQLPADTSVADAPRFGQRRSSRYLDETPVRVRHLPREALRTLVDLREADPALVPKRASKRARENGTGDATDIAHEGATEDATALRAEVTRLKEALADLVVENRTLRQRLDLHTQMTASDAQSH